MNYRHHYHAGNFADVVKHVLMLMLIQGMQRKDKGFLYLDTHSGRGRYDLLAAARGDTQERKPEWPEGVGRVWTAENPPAEILRYRELVAACNRGEGAAPAAGTDTGAPLDAASLRHYPGSPWLAQALAREQDRLFLCEKHPEEFEILRDEMSVARRATVQQIDGYTALRAALPPLEKRALVLIDPPFEQQDEFSKLAKGLAETLRRMQGATVAVWYPLTERARVEAFFDEIALLKLPPCWSTELCVCGEEGPLRMRGCGLLVINPPWKLDRQVEALLPWLCDTLAQEEGAQAALHWLVEDK